MYLVISLLVLRAGCGNGLYQFLIIAYLFISLTFWFLPSFQSCFFLLEPSFSAASQYFLFQIPTPFLFSSGSVFWFPFLASTIVLDSNTVAILLFSYLELSPFDLSSFSAHISSNFLAQSHTLLPSSEGKAIDLALDVIRDILQITFVIFSDSLPVLQALDYT